MRRSTAASAANLTDSTLLRAKQKVQGVSYMLSACLFSYSLYFITNGEEEGEEEEKKKKKHVSVFLELYSIIFTLFQN